MAKGIRHHLKRINAPKHWRLDKLSGVWAPRSRSGPHKMRESLPLILIIRNVLKYATTYREAVMVTMGRNVMVDGQVRTDIKFPTGLMDVISIPKVNKNFRMIFDARGRYKLQPITSAEADLKLLRVDQIRAGRFNAYTVVTHDGRSIRYPTTQASLHGSIVYNLKTKTIERVLPLAVGSTVTVRNGNSIGRIGVIQEIIMRHGKKTILAKDSNDCSFLTIVENVVVIGDANGMAISLPENIGLRISQATDRQNRIAAFSTFGEVELIDDHPAADMVEEVEAEVAEA